MNGVMPAGGKSEIFTYPWTYTTLHMTEAIIVTEILMQVLKPQIS